MKSTRLVLALLFFISFCSDSSTPISLNSLDDITGSTTNKIEISNSDWDNYIGKSMNEEEDYLLEISDKNANAALKLINFIIL